MIENKSTYKEYGELACNYIYLTHRNSSLSLVDPYYKEIVKKNIRICIFIEIIYFLIRNNTIRLDHKRFLKELNEFLNKK